MIKVTDLEGADFRVGGRKILREPEVKRRTGKSRAQRWRDIRKGIFPVPVELGPNSIGWYEDELEEWLASRPRRRYGAPTEPAAA